MGLKEDLEIEKLKIEVKQLKTPFRKKLTTWQFIVPTFTTIATLLLLYTNGAFDIKSQRLELKKERLEWEILQYESQKTKLFDSVWILTNQQTQLEDSIVEVQNTLHLLKGKLSTAEEKISKLKVQKEKLETTIKNGLEISIDYSKYHAFPESGDTYYLSRKDILESKIKNELEGSFKTKTEMRKNWSSIKGTLELRKIPSVVLDSDEFKKIVLKIIEQDFPNLPE